MSEVTKPILLDETGQEIRDALLGIKAAMEKPSGGYEEGYAACENDILGGAW